MSSLSSFFSLLLYSAFPLFSHHLFIFLLHYFPSFPHLLLILFLLFPRFVCSSFSHLLFCLLFNVLVLLVLFSYSLFPLLLLIPYSTFSVTQKQGKHWIISMNNSNYLRYINYGSCLPPLPLTGQVAQRLVEDEVIIWSFRSLNLTGPQKKKYLSEVS